MKNKIISIFTSLTIIAGVLIPCFAFVNADEGRRNLTHKTAVIQNFESYGSFDEFKDFINNSNYTDVGFKAQNGGKALSFTAGEAGKKYSAEIKITGNSGFPLQSLSSDYFAFKLKTPGETGNHVPVCLRLSVWNDLGNTVNFPSGTKIEYSKNFSDENDEVESAVFNDGGRNVWLPAGEEYTYRINIKETFAENASKLNSVWAMYFEINPENKYAGEFVLDDFELHTVSGTPAKEGFDDEALTADDVSDGLRNFAVSIENGIGTNGSSALKLAGKGDAFSYVRLNRGRAADLTNNTDRLYWYMDISGISADTVEMGLGFTIDGMAPITEAATFNRGSLTCADSLEQLENGDSKVVDGEKWAFKMPVGKHWYCLDLNRALALQYTAGLGKVYNLWFQYNKWNGSTDMSDTYAEFVIDSILSKKTQTGGSNHEDGGFMNENYNDVGLELDSIYRNDSNYGFSASLITEEDGGRALKLVGETRSDGDGGFHAPQGYLLTNRGFSASLIKDGHNYIYFHLDITGTNKASVPMGIVPVIHGSINNGLLSGYLEYADTVEQLEGGNKHKTPFGDGWSAEVPTGSHWFRISMDECWNDQQRSWADSCKEINFKLNPSWGDSGLIPSGKITFVIDDLYTKKIESSSETETGAMNEDYDSEGLTVDDVCRNDGFTASVAMNKGINGSNALKFIGSTGDNGRFAPMIWLYTNRGNSADLTKDGHNYIYFHLDISGTNDKFVPMGIVPELNGNTPDGLFDGELEYAEKLADLDNGKYKKTNFGGGWSVDVPTGSHWFRICLEKAYSEQQMSWAKNCKRISFKLNPVWHGDVFVPSGNLTFIIDSLHTKHIEIKEPINKDGGFMNESYDDADVTLDDVYQGDSFEASLTSGGVNGSTALKLVGGTGDNGNFAPMGWLYTNRGASADLTKDGHNYIYFHLDITGTKNKTVPMGIVPDIGSGTPDGLFGGTLEYANKLEELDNGRVKKCSFNGGGWSVDVPTGSHWFRICLTKSYNAKQLNWAKSCKKISFKLNPVWNGDTFVPSGNLTFIIDSVHTKYAEVFGSVHKDGEEMNETYDERGLTVDDVYQGDSFEASLTSGGVNGGTALKLVGGTGDNGNFAPMGWLYTNRGMKANLVKDGHNYIYFHLNITGTKNKTVPMGIVPELNGSTNNGLFTGTLEYADSLNDFEKGNLKKNSFKSGGWSVDVPTGSHWFRICLNKAYTFEQLGWARECTKISFKLNPNWQGDKFLPSGRLTLIVDSLHTEYHKVYGTVHKDGQTLNENYDEFGLQAGETAEPSNSDMTMSIAAKKGVNRTSALQLGLKKGDSAELLLNRGYTANLLANESNYLYFHINSSGAKQKLLQLGLTLDLKGLERTDCTFGGYLEYADTLEAFRDVSSIHRARFISDGWNIKLPANKSYWVRVNLNNALSAKALPYAAGARSLTFKLNMEYQSDERVNFLIDSLFTANDKTPAFDTKPDELSVECDDDYRWQVTDNRGDILLDTVTQKSGRGAINLFGSDLSGELWMRYVFNRPLNISGIKMRNSFEYSVWVRTEYADKIKAITVSLAAEGGVKDDGTQNWGQFITWSFNGEEFQNGKWTKLSFNYYSPSKSYESWMQFTRIKGLYVRIIAKNPGDYVEATFDRFEYSDNRKVIESNINAPLKLSAASFKPQSLDKNIINFLNYKAVIAEGITVKQIKEAVKLDSKYTLGIVDKNGNEIGDDETVKSGMWLLVKYKKTEVSMYYIEIGNPIDISGIEDVPMPGRPLMLSAENNSGKVSGNGVKNINTVLVIIIAAVCLAAAGTASFIVIKHKKDKSQKNISNE